MIGEDLKAFLESDAAIAEVVGNRVYHSRVPQGKLSKPYIYYQMIGASDDIALDDAAGLPNRWRYVVECWGTTAPLSQSLATLVTAKLHKHRGTFGSRTVQGVFVTDADEGYEPAGGGADMGMHSSTRFCEVVL